MNLVALSGCSTCWNGTEFLLGNKIDWPQQKFKLAEKSNVEFKNTVKTYIVSVTCQTLTHQEWRLDFNRFSNRKRLSRVIGWVKRFIQNKRLMKEQQDVGHLSPAEMVDAEVYIIKSSQKEHLKQEYEALQRRSMICKKNKVAPASQLMELLPQIRLKFSIRAFSNVGIDFAGPSLTIRGRGKTRNKK